MHAPLSVTSLPIGMIRVTPAQRFVQRIHAELTQFGAVPLRYGHQDDQPGSPETVRRCDGTSGRRLVPDPVTHLVRSNRCRPITTAPMLAHIGRTYPAEACETLNMPPSTIGTPPLKYQSNSGPTSSLVSAMKPSTDTTACMNTVFISSP